MCVVYEVWETKSGNVIAEHTDIERAYEYVLDCADVWDDAGVTLALIAIVDNEGIGVAGGHDLVALAGTSLE